MQMEIRIETILYVMENLTRKKIYLEKKKKWKKTM